MSFFFFFYCSRVQIKLEKITYFHLVCELTRKEEKDDTLKIISLWVKQAN